MELGRHFKMELSSRYVHLSYQAKCPSQCLFVKNVQLHDLLLITKFHVSLQHYSVLDSKTIWWKYKNTYKTQVNYTKLIAPSLYYDLCCWQANMDYSLHPFPKPTSGFIKATKNWTKRKSLGMSSEMVIAISVLVIFSSWTRITTSTSEIVSVTPSGKSADMIRRFNYLSQSPTESLFLLSTEPDTACMIPSLDSPTQQVWSLLFVTVSSERDRV